MHALAPHLPTQLSGGTLRLIAASSVSDDLRDQLYALFDNNIAPLAKGTSMEHTKAEKWEEMFHHDARYLIIQRDEELVGFASFRFDTEETMGPKDVEVVYWCVCVLYRTDCSYELQLAPSARGHGLGRRLMKELEDIGQRAGMTKSMLTCLTGNSAALAFYEQVGYTPDEIDPTRVAEEEDWEEEEDRDYRILSKLL